MAENKDRQGQPYERKVIQTDETEHKGYRPSGPPLDPTIVFEPQPTNATLPSPPVPPVPPKTDENSGGQTSDDSGS